VFDLRMMKMSATLQAHDSAVQSIAFARDTKLIYTGSKDGTLKVSRPFLMFAYPCIHVAILSSGRAIHYGCRCLLCLMSAPVVSFDRPAC
jgi:hypothetical protein